MTTRVIINIIRCEQCCVSMTYYRVIAVAVVLTSARVYNNIALYYGPLECIGVTWKMTEKRLHRIVSPPR